MRVCAYTECGLEFEPKTHNQRYHEDECCRLATNARLMQQYYDRKARKQGRIRICTIPGCNTKLSRYNEASVCQKCSAEMLADSRKRLLEMLVA